MKLIKEVRGEMLEKIEEIAREISGRQVIGKRDDPLLGKLEFNRLHGQRDNIYLFTRALNLNSERIFRSSGILFEATGYEIGEYEKNLKDFQIFYDITGYPQRDRESPRYPDISWGYFTGINEKLRFIYLDKQIFSWCINEDDCGNYYHLCGIDTEPREVKRVMEKFSRIPVVSC